MTFLPKMILGAALAVVAATAAQAFTFENPGATTGDTKALRFGTGDSRFSTNSSAGGNSSSSVRPGSSAGSGLSFGAQPSFNQRYNADRMFEPNSLMGRER